MKQFLLFIFLALTINVFAENSVYREAYYQTNVFERLDANQTIQMNFVDDYNPTKPKKEEVLEEEQITSNQKHYGVYVSIEEVDGFDDSGNALILNFGQDSGLYEGVGFEGETSYSVLQPDSSTGSTGVFTLAGYTTYEKALLSRIALRARGGALIGYGTKTSNFNMDLSLGLNVIYKKIFNDFDLNSGITKSGDITNIHLGIEKNF